MKINKNIFFSLLFSMLLIFFTGCTNYDPWLSSGITKQEADKIASTIKSTLDISTIVITNK